MVLVILPFHSLHNCGSTEILTSLKCHVIVTVYPEISSVYYQSSGVCCSSRKHRGTTTAFHKEMTTNKMTNDQKSQTTDGITDLHEQQLQSIYRG